MEFIVAKSRYSRQLDSIMYETHMKKKIIILDGTNVPKCSEVDKKLTNLDLSKIDFVLTKNTFPNYKGDFNKDIDGEYMLKDMASPLDGAIFFSFNKKGQVTRGYKVIPTTAWVKFDFEFIDKNLFPTTPEGMGIRYVVINEGDGYYNNTLGYKKEKNYPRPTSPVLASSVIPFFSSKMEYAIGDIILAKTSDMLKETDFCQLDGTVLSRSNAELFNIIGDTYSYTYGGRSYGIPWKYSKFSHEEVDTGGDLEFETISIPLLNNLAGTAMFATKQNVYFCGGFRGDREEISDDIIIGDIVGGELKNVRVGSKLPEKLCFASAYMTEEFIILIGGVSDFSTNTPTKAKIWTAKKTSTGFGPWTNTLPDLPDYKMAPYVRFCKNRIYVVGGKKIIDGVIKNDQCRYYVDIEKDLTTKRTWKTERNHTYVSDSNGVGSGAWTSQGFCFTSIVENTSGVPSNKYMQYYNYNFKDQVLVNTIDVTRSRYVEGQIAIPYTNVCSFEKKTHSSDDGNSWRFLSFLNTPEGFCYGDSYISKRTSSTVYFEKLVTEQPLPRTNYEILITSTSLYVIGGLTENLLSGKANGTALRVLKHNFAPHDVNLKEKYDESVIGISNDNDTFTLPYVDATMFNGEMYRPYIKYR